MLLLWYIMMGVGWAMMVATLFIKTDYELFLIVGGLLVSSFSIIMQTITGKKLNKNKNGLVKEIKISEEK